MGLSSPYHSRYYSISLPDLEKHLTEFFRNPKGHKMLQEVFYAHHGGTTYRGRIDVTNATVANVLKKYGTSDIGIKENRDKLSFMEGVYSNLESYLKKSKLEHAQFSDTEMVANALWEGKLQTKQQMDQSYSSIII